MYSSTNQQSIYLSIHDFLPSGLAYTGALCSTSQQSIVEDSFHATTATVAAHELGHRYEPSV